MTPRLSLAVFAFAALCASTSVALAAKPSPKPSPSPTPGPPWSNMTWRAIGPATAGGRVAAVAGSARDPKLYYVGSAGGGVWRSTNGGQTWDPVFEDQKVAAIGAVAIDPSDDKTVWVGTGEANPRNDVSYGDGLYKSIDGGKTWKRVGLKDTRYISRIVVDPKDSKHVVVSAFGDFFHDSKAGGVYVTFDGGKTWQQTLYVGPESGGSDLAMSMQKPNIVYAGIWQFRRKPWTFQSGGPDDGLYKSTDGGKTWTRLTGHGLPGGIEGRIGLAVAPSDGNYVYAIIESKDGILWKSTDGGASWKMVSHDTLVDQRPFYFTHLAVSPGDRNTVYAVSEMLAKSTDGGKKFKAIAVPVHVDYHAIWIAPNDPKRIMMGEDGGFALTVDGGKNWFFSMNLPIGQIYHVGLSNENPYWVCAGLQDNNAWCAPSNSLDTSGIPNKYWIAVAGGDGEWAVPDPTDPNWIWADSEDGSLTVFNKKTYDGWSAQPYLQTMMETYDLRTSKYRFNWDSPIAFAPWNGHIAWYGANVVFQSTDRGRSWKPISPDLTLNDKAHQIPSGGPITHDVSGAEYSDTILDIEGSPLHRGEIWVGTDDGLVQMTLNGGASWHNVTPPGVPPYGRVETVAPSHIKDGTVYVSIDRHRSGDYKPYLFVSHDFGKHWTSIIKGLPADQYVRTVRPDIHNPDVVYAGTEEGMWLSLDGGKTWHDFKNGLPTVSVRDIRMQPQFDDLVIGTHGRSAYIMDDVRPIQDLTKAVAAGTMLWAPRVSYQYNTHSNDEGVYTNYAADNPPTGAMIYFYQAKKQKHAPKIEILDASGRAIRTISGTHTVNKKKVPYVSNKVGINRYVWDFAIDGPVKWKGAARKRYQGPNEGPGVPPGRYSVRVTLDGHTYTEPFVVKADPRTIITQAEMVQSFNLAKKYYHEYSVVDTMLNNLDKVKKQLDAQAAKAKERNDSALSAKIDAAQSARTAIFNELTADYHNDEDSIQRPGKLRENVSSAMFAAQGLITPPVVNYLRRVDDLYRAGVEKYNAYVGTLPTNVTGVKTVEAGI